MSFFPEPAPPPGSDSMFELLAERLLDTRASCTCEFPGQASLECPAYDRSLDGTPWLTPRDDDE